MNWFMEIVGNVLTGGLGFVGIVLLASSLDLDKNDTWLTRMQRAILGTLFLSGSSAVFYAAFAIKSAESGFGLNSSDSGLMTGAFVLIVLGLISGIISVVLALKYREEVIKKAIQIAFDTPVPRKPRTTVAPATT